MNGRRDPSLAARGDAGARRPATPGPAIPKRLFR